MHVFICSTCIPEDELPCIPDVFATLAEARACADAYMRAEWPGYGQDDSDPYPGAQAAHDRLADQSGWGRYRITEHDLATNVFVGEHDLSEGAEAPK